MNNENTVKNSESIEQRPHKPLIYILPNENSSFQQMVTSTVESAVTDLAIVDSGTMSEVISLTKESFLAVSISMIPFGRTVLPIILSYMDSKKTNSYSPNEPQDSQESINKEHANLENVLKQLNIGDWIAFVEQIPYSDIPNELEFPPGHPLPGRLYRAHPLKKERQRYIPIEVFDSLLYAEREAELIRLLVDLGATKITIQEFSGEKTEASAKAGVQIAGSGGISAKLNGTGSQVDSTTREFTLKGKHWTDNMSIDQNAYSWLHYEPAWSAVAHARLKGGCCSASIELTKDSSYSISGELGLTEGLLQKIASIDTGAAISQNINQKRIIRIEFAGFEIENK